MKEINGIGPINMDEAKCECPKAFITSLGYECREVSLWDGNILFLFLNAETNNIVARSEVKSYFKVYTDAFDKK